MEITVETVVNAGAHRLEGLERPGGHQAVERRLRRLAHDDELGRPA